MADSVLLASDVVAGATALAGLILVYIGNVSSAFAAFTREQQSTVRVAHQVRVWLAFVGFISAVTAAGLALIGKWMNSGYAVGASVILLLLALTWGAGTAFMAAWDVR
jgi:hypothetical protein